MAKLPNLNDRVVAERRAPDFAGDGAGNFEQGWTGIGPAHPLRAEIRELVLGSEEAVLSGDLAGVQRCTVTLRASTLTSSLTTDDRFRVLGSDRILNIRQAPPPGRDRFITFRCEAGVAT